MHPSEEEIKIVEKIKFWEEQEKINGVLVERLINLNKEITVLQAENKLNKKQLDKIFTLVDEVTKESHSLRQKNSQNIAKISQLEKRLISLNQYIEDQTIQKKSYTGEERKSKTTGFRAIHVTFISSILALIFSLISLFV